MSVMRSTLWPGMLLAAARNAARQQDRIRLFEHGKSFHGELGRHDEVDRIAGVVMGAALPEQWGTDPRPVDFYDVKSDVTAVLALTGLADPIGYEMIEHPALQPGQSAAVVRDGQYLGFLGKLHPTHAKNFELKRDVFVFELDVGAAFVSRPPSAEAISKFPSIRRDIAVVVKDDVSTQQIVEAVASSAPDLIASVVIFDVYKGAGIEAGLKSIALGLILQETSRTLTDDDADDAMRAAVTELKHQFAAELRD